MSSQVWNADCGEELRENHFIPCLFLPYQDSQRCTRRTSLGVKRRALIASTGAPVTLSWLSDDFAAGEDEHEPMTASRRDRRRHF